VVLTALRGAVGFLTRVPVGADEHSWNAFRRSPVVFPLAGYAIGAVATVPLLLPIPAPTVAVLFVLGLYLLTGITHVDGVADLGDALVVHGSRAERREVLKDTTVGVGAVVSVGILLLGLTMAALTLASLPQKAVLLVVTAEVSAKLGMAAVACFGTATHEGLGSALTGPSGPRSLLAPALVSLPAAAITWPQPASAVAFAGGLLSTAAIFLWARHRLGGISGDVFGAGNEITRVVALHAGVIAWTQL
jgi:adenosylcobinamide-GDP ribazoletransferase